jgi:polyketide biosynthesis enoyl-CoA hydratase PksI
MNGSMLFTTGDDGISRCHFNDQANKNAFTGKFIDAFMEGLDRLEKEAATRVLVIRGLPDVFCAGADKESLLALCEGEMRVKDLLIPERLLAVPFPVIAAMEGHATGGGLMVAVYCDIVIAARESRYGAPFISLGFTPGMGCTALLERLVGPYIAAEMMLTGRPIKGSELAGKGVNINHIVPKSEVLPMAESIAQRIAENSDRAIMLLKQTLAAEKKRTLVDARVREDLMHRITFALPQTKRTIRELYPDIEGGRS